MTKLLSIAANPDAPVACNMTGAEDTLTDRLAEYRRLFDHALIGRTSTDTTTTFRFRARPGVREWVLDLVRREAACCPFLSYEVDLEGDQVVWTTSGGLARPTWLCSTSSLPDPRKPTPKPSPSNSRPVAASRSSCRQGVDTTAGSRPRKVERPSVGNSAFGRAASRARSVGAGPST